MYAIAASLSAIAVNLFFIKNPDFFEPVRFNFIVSIIAAAIAILAAIFRRLASRLHVLLNTMEGCVLAAILTYCGNEKEAKDLCAFAVFTIEDLFTFRVQLKMLSEITNVLACSELPDEFPCEDLDGTFSRILSVFCGYLKDIQDDCKRGFVRSQPEYQKILSLNNPR